MSMARGIRFPSWGPALLILLLSIASSRLPVESSVQRFGSQRPRKSRTCLSEQSGSTLQAKAPDRSTGNALPNEFARALPKSAEPSWRAISPVSATRLALGERRPEYLKSFAPWSPPSTLPPPRA